MPGVVSIPGTVHNCRFSLWLLANVPRGCSVEPEGNFLLLETPLVWDGSRIAKGTS